MPLIPFPVDQFGGLNLAVDPTDVGTSGAVDLADVDVDHPGQLRTRIGRGFYSSADGSTFSDDPLRIVEEWFTATVYEASPTKFAAISSGAVNSAALTAATHYSPDILSFTTSAPFVMDGAGFKQWDSFSHVLNTIGGSHPYGGMLANWAFQGRLVTAGASLTGENLDRVFFSDPGIVTWTSTNWVDLNVGREMITGIVEHNEAIYVFKETQAFVFYGTSTQADGSAVFNYRPVELGDRVPNFNSAGSVRIAPGRFVSDGKAIYYPAASGIYRLSGYGPPVRISEALDPIFAGEVTTYGNAYGTSTQAGCCVAPDRVYVYAPGCRTLVYDKATGNWSTYTITPTAMFPDRTKRGAYATESKRVTRLASGTTTDLGSAITWSYTTGYSSAGGYFRQRIISSGERKRHHHVDILGSGTVTHQVLTLNPRVADIADPGGSVTLGTAPAIARGKRRRGARGTHIAHKLSGSGPATISGLTYWLTNVGSDT